MWKALAVVMTVLAWMVWLLVVAPLAQSMGPLGWIMVWTAALQIGGGVTWVAWVGVMEYRSGVKFRQDPEMMRLAEEARRNGFGRAP